MTVRIRLARFGCKHHPFYRVVAADSRCDRDGKHLEVLGFYDPLAGDDDIKRFALKFDRVKYWLSVGAQASEPVERILARAGLAVAEKGGTHAFDMAYAFESTGTAEQPNPPLPLCIATAFAG